jgi:hypothetical protein
MEDIDPTIVQRLRSLAQEGRTVPELLRDIPTKLSPAKVHTLLLAKYMREAFGLSLLDVKPIGGWAFGGTGELSDARLNELMLPAVNAKRPWWENQMIQSNQKVRT